MTMTNNDISGGVVHPLPEDLRKTLASDAEARASWEDLTPLARNEWICWAISVKNQQPEGSTLNGCARNPKRACADLAVGMAVFTARIRQSALRYKKSSSRNKLKSHHK
jgi:bacteriocin resistance YdeI/OmpD-like protein